MRAWPLMRVGEPTHPMRTSSLPVHRSELALFPSLSRLRGEWKLAGEDRRQVDDFLINRWLFESTCVSYISEKHSVMNGFKFPRRSLPAPKTYALTKWLDSLLDILHPHNNLQLITRGLIWRLTIRWYAYKLQSNIHVRYLCLFRGICHSYEIPRRLLSRNFLDV